MAPTGNQYPQLQDPTPQRKRRIMRKTRAQGRQARGGIGEEGREAKKRKKQLKNYRNKVASGGDLVGRSKKRRQEIISSVGAHRGYLKNSKEAETEIQAAECLNKNLRENMSPLSGLIRGFRNS